MKSLSKRHELRVNCIAVGLAIVNPDRDRRVLLKAIEELQAAPTPPASQRLWRIGNALKLAQNELRHDDRFPQEPNPTDIGDPPVDNGARIQQNAGRARPASISDIPL